MKSVSDKIAKKTTTLKQQTTIINNKKVKKGSISNELISFR